MARKASKQAQPAKDYLATARRYAREVVSGAVIGCELLRKRCQQFLDELARDDEGWDFRFDAAKASHACTFIECLPIPDSAEDARFTLQPWQVFIVANLFGWVHASTGLRRFTQAHIWIAAGNGKSALASAIGLYMAFGVGQRASEVACVAYSKKQAEVVFDTAKQMMQFRPDFAEWLGLEINAHTIVQERTGSKFEPRSSEAKTLAGMRPYCAIVDELHVVDQAVYSFLTNRLAKRDQTLLLTISTAGYDTNTIGGTIFEESKAVIEGTIDSPEVFAVIFQAESENLLDESEWAKAHPNLGVTVRNNILRSKAKEAMDFSQLRVSFITEQLNRWASSREAWLKMEKWDECAAPSLRLADFAGRKAFIGLDMSQRNDITAKAYVFADADGQGRRTYTAFFKCYLPEAAIAARNASYSGWVHDGHIASMEGEVIDFAVVEDELLEDLQTFPGSEVCYDPAFMTQMAQSIQNEAGPEAAIEVRPTRENFNPAMKELEAAVLEGRLRHDGNPAVRWQMGNVTVKPNAAGVIYPAKPHSNAKIDAAYALFSGLVRAQRADLQDSPLIFKWL